MEALRSLFSRGVILAIFLLGFFLTAITLVMLWFSRPERAAIGEPTAILMVTALPRLTSAPTEGLPTATQALDVPLTDETPADLAVGAFVVVQGTEGGGLRVRAAPGLSEGVRFLASEGETFEIKDGPRNVDGYTWWRLASSSSAERSGWAVADYLKITQAP